MIVMMKLMSNDEVDNIKNVREKRKELVFRRES